MVSKGQKIVLDEKFTESEVISRLAHELSLLKYVTVCSTIDLGRTKLFETRGEMEEKLATIERQNVNLEKCNLESRREDMETIKDSRQQQLEEMSKMNRETSMFVTR